MWQCLVMSEVHWYEAPILVMLRMTPAIASSFEILKSGIGPFLPIHPPARTIESFKVWNSRRALRRAWRCSSYINRLWAWKMNSTRARNALSTLSGTAPAATAIRIFSRSRCSRPVHCLSFETPLVQWCCPTWGWRAAIQQLSSHTGWANILLRDKLQSKRVSYILNFSHV